MINHKFSRDFSQITSGW